jgi:hypothetical protein
MEKLQSKKLELPTVYYITAREKIKELPVGVPFIFGSSKEKKHIIRLLEYEVLYQNAIKTGYPFNFHKILMENGYDDLNTFGFTRTVFQTFDFSEEAKEEGDGEGEVRVLDELDCPRQTVSDFIKDNAAYVDIQKLKDLNVFPVWLESIEQAVYENINRFALYNHSLYNKKLDGLYGDIELTVPSKNLIIIDISGSIPRAVSATCLTLAKNLSENFYADLLITGSKSTLYDFNDIPSLDIDALYKENGMDNDQTYFKKLLTADTRKYKTAIIFGDNHSPCQSWSNNYNKKTSRISREDGKKLCKWSVEKIISFHTTDKETMAGYGDWFSTEEVEHIENWVKYLQ